MNRFGVPPPPSFPARDRRGPCWPRANPDTVIIGRTEARDVEGLEAALDRARRYAAAGAELVFVEAPQSADELARIAREFPGAAMANLVEGGKTPLLLVARLQALGFRLVIFPNLLTRVMATAALETLAALKLSGGAAGPPLGHLHHREAEGRRRGGAPRPLRLRARLRHHPGGGEVQDPARPRRGDRRPDHRARLQVHLRSEEHTSELQP